MKIATILLLLAGLDPVGAWRYTTDRDAMTDRPTRVAETDSYNFIEFSFPYGDPQHATLGLRRRGADESAYVRVQRGQFLCGPVNCAILVRFDDGPLRHYGAAPPDDGSSDLLFIFASTHDFIERMKKARRVRIEATFYREGSRVLDFRPAALSSGW